MTRTWQEEDQLKWLGREAPRYTSYPSAHHFESLAPSLYAGWLRALAPGKSVGLYVHVPFCEQMCWFCGCNTQITRHFEPIAAYVDSLVAEIAMIGGMLQGRPKAHALHFGGGSPGILHPKDMSRLFAALQGFFDFLPGAEISLELDPRRITQEKVAAYAALGFNRVSLGVQDTQDDVQRAINRVQPMSMIAKSVDLLRAHGLNAIGIDLVYGLPGQTVASIGATLRDVAALDPDRISAFSYAHVPWVKKHQRLIDDTHLPDIAEKSTQYMAIDQGLCRLGYTAVGIDHFAKPDDGLAKALASGTLRRNFMGYTDLPNDRLIAFGASSISELDEGLAQNIPQATTYRTRIAAGDLPTSRGWIYRDDDLVRREVISSLMCYFRADIGAILARHDMPADYLDQDIASLADFAGAGLVTTDHRVVIFDAPLKMLVRSVAAAFDRYMQAPDGTSRYSRVA